MIKWLLGKFTHVYDTLKKCPEKIKETKIYWYFGRWRHDPCLPVWRRGPVISIAKYHQYYRPRRSVVIPDGIHEWEYGGKIIKSPKFKQGPIHKVPEIAWIRPCRQALRRFHLGWLKPEYQLPIWFSFHIFNHDVIWKWKWEDTRFEFPPQFTIVAFGFSLSFWVKPEYPPHGVEDFWWEPLLEKLFNSKKD